MFKLIVALCIAVTLIIVGIVLGRSNKKKVEVAAKIVKDIKKDVSE